jgi:hypothetical protein
MSTDNKPIEIEETIEVHNVCDNAIVHPHGQIQNIKDCWCKVYHAFRPNITIDDVECVHFKDDIYCYIWKDAEKNQQPPNSFLMRKSKRKIFGPVIMFKKGEDFPMERAKFVLEQSNNS